ncbi:hypothetical protein JXX18_16350, partial [Ruthenibacterium lactatiformans]|uniref:hypothetical protein n=1 Tax=Ruthenibacterium lactatiformans TaxID=1550024 RepID=UPI003266B958|nr:hypothetical protein [Ruthenibacterium lactatiformans]
KDGKRRLFLSAYFLFCRDHCGFRQFFGICQRVHHSDSIDTYNRNMLIEIQFRTHLQHLWATAVETMGLFTKEAIKSGQGDAEVKRFFQLASALIAKKENQPIPPNVVDDIDEIISELEGINSKNNYLDFLKGVPFLPVSAPFLTLTSLVRLVAKRNSPSQKPYFRSDSPCLFMLSK